MRRLLVAPIAAAGIAAAALSCGGAAAILPTQAADAASRATHGREAPKVDRRHSRRLRVTRATRPRRRSGHVPAWVLQQGPLGGPGTVAPGASPSPGMTPGPGGGTLPPATTCKSSIGAREGEWYIASTSPAAKLCAGTVHIEAQNWGEDEHDLWIRDAGGHATELTGALVAPKQGTTPGLQQTSTTLTPGTYTLFCSLISGGPQASHELSGMKTTITVVGP